MQDTAENEQHVSQEQAIYAFIDDILAQKNLPGIEIEQVKQYVRQDLTERLMDQIDRALIGALPEEKAEKFSALLDNEEVTAQEVQQFIIDAGVDVPKVTALTMVQFRDLYLEKTVE